MTVFAYAVLLTGCSAENINKRNLSPPDSEGPFSAVEAGYRHSCALTQEGYVYCWYSAGEQESTPSGVLTSLSVGKNTSCGIDSSGSIQCWGSSEFSFGSPPAGLFISIEVGNHSVCAIQDDHRVYCWNEDGGDNISDSTYLQYDVGWGFHSCGIDSQGLVRCHGGTAEETEEPTGRHKYVAVGDAISCALEEDDFAYCWGDTDSRFHDLEVSEAMQLDVERSVAVALDSDGRLEPLGSFFNDLVYECQLSFEETGAIKQISLGVGPVCALFHDGTIHCEGQWNSDDD